MLVQQVFVVLKSAERKHKIYQRKCLFDFFEISIGPDKEIL